jgi:RNase H-like domain found in reverse transcriptase/Reverse transcriptase (RNA-dependent DNA polymerase)
VNRTPGSVRLRCNKVSGRTARAAQSDFVRIASGKEVDKLVVIDDEVDEDRRRFHDSESRNTGSDKEGLPKFIPTPRSLARLLRVSRKSDLRSVVTQMQVEHEVKMIKDLIGVRGRPGLRVNTMYKRKAEKVRPVDSSQSDGSIPGGRDDWRERAIAREREQGKHIPRGKFDHWLYPRTADFEREVRMTSKRLASLQIGDMLTPQERELFIECLYNREASLSWTFDEIGRVSSDVAPPQRIRTIPHEAWQAPQFPIPKGLHEIVKEMLRDRLKRGTLERCHGPYRNPWFLVKKKDGNYRLINAAMWLNKVTIRDATLPPTADEFAERFAGMKILTLADLHSGYDQCPLDERDRDMTAFHTPIGLLRLTTLPQGATNSVGQFVRVMNRILDAVHREAGAFIDDVGIEGPRTDYGNEEVAPGIRKFVLEHVQKIDKVLLEFERAGATIAAEKTQWCMPGVKIVGYVCDSEGRHPDSAKVVKILDWPACEDPTEVKGFLGVCVYYRIWIADFALIASPLYILTKKGAIWRWGEEQDLAMFELKIALTNAPALVTIDYGPDGGLIIVAFDASKKGWGAVIMQLDKNGRRHPVRFESGVWTVSESNYDAGKRECRALLKTLKKFRHWLYGVHFLLETDANTLCAQLNRTATDLPGALVTQWLAWIRFFDFEVRHIPGTKNVVADALSRRPPTEDDIRERDNEQDIDE